MSTAALTPNPNINAIATLGGVFSREECERIVTSGTRLAGKVGGVGGVAPAREGAADGVRKTAVSWLDPAASEPVYRKIRQIALDMNEKLYKFDLTGFGDPIQFTRYERIGDYYTWHQDLASGASSLRKLSVVVQLSDPAAYRGCDLELYSEGKPVPQACTQGTVLVFPAWQLHRVTALEAGVRYSLVAWFAGQPFR